MTNEAREKAIDGICQRTGKTREQAEAFLDLLGSAMKRRGWIEGEPLTQDEMSSKLGIFLGSGPTGEPA